VALAFVEAIRDTHGATRDQIDRERTRTAEQAAAT
jgi:hypothetical protein